MTNQEFKAKLEGMKLYSWQIEKLESLLDHYGDAEEMLTSIKDEDDGLSERIDECADGEVSVYHGSRFEWASNNANKVLEYEDEAIAMGSKSVSDMIAWCWYETEREEIWDVVRDLQKKLEEDAE